MAPDGGEALRSFRGQLYGSFTCWGDALFELCDAVLCGVGPVSSNPLAQPRARVLPQPRQPLQGTQQGPGQRGPAAQAPCRQPASGLAGGFCCRCLHLGALRRGVQSGAGLLLLGLQPLCRPADRCRMVLSVDLPALMGPGQLDCTARRHAHPAGERRDISHRRTDPSPRQPSCQKTARCHCSSSTPAMTRLPSVTTSPGRGSRCSAGSATTASSTPIPLLAPTVRHGAVGVLHDTEGLEVLRSCDLDDAVGQPRRHRSPLRHRHGHCLARRAPAAVASRALVGLPDASDRQGQHDPSQSRAPTETDRPHKEDALAVVVRQR